MSVATSDKSDRLCTSGAMLAALRAKFAPPEYAFLTEVPDGTGLAKSRSADALVMGLWPSRGLHLTGFEVKVSRQDWQRELANPAKAEAICRYCDRWYVAVGDASIVRPGELPPTWGLMVPRGSSLVVKVEAPPLTPAPIDRAFLAAICRRVNESEADSAAIAEMRQRHQYEIKDAEKKGFERGKQATINNGDQMLKRATSDLATLRRAVDEFEAASGVKIHNWYAQQIGESVDFVLAKKLEHHKHVMDAVAKYADDLKSLTEKYRTLVDESAEGGGR